MDPIKKSCDVIFYYLQIWKFSKYDKLIYGFLKIHKAPSI